MNNIIIFTDCGDTIIDETTQTYAEDGTVLDADFLPGAKDTLKYFKDAGYRIAMVADGTYQSFANMYEKNGMRYCFEEWIISEVVGAEKPARIMFETAMEKMGLTDADKPRIVMIGNNLKRDIAGANRFGISSIWIDWSKRYFNEIEEPDWQPDYTVHEPKELIPLIAELEENFKS
ncbi:MAG: HAD hydrolase-like protein [Lachnospiraceae bacterium]|nr:HAD hydrolase-like protein [Lachnospiraceae bacterium]